MSRIQNITADDIKNAGGQLKLTISEVTVESLSKLDGTNAVHDKIVLHLNEADGSPYKSFIANKTSLGRLASIEPDPKQWKGLVVVIKCKKIAIVNKLDPDNIRYEDQKYIDSVEGSAKIDLVDQLISKLLS